MPARSVLARAALLGAAAAAAILVFAIGSDPDPIESVVAKGDGAAPEEVASTADSDLASVGDLKARAEAETNESEPASKRWRNAVPVPLVADLVDARDGRPAAWVRVRARDSRGVSIDLRADGEGRLRTDELLWSGEIELHVHPGPFHWDSGLHPIDPERVADRRWAVHWIRGGKTRRLPSDGSIPEWTVPVSRVVALDLGTLPPGAELIAGISRTKGGAERIRRLSTLDDIREAVRVYEQDVLELDVTERGPLPAGRVDTSHVVILGEVGADGTSQHFASSRHVPLEWDARVPDRRIAVAALTPTEAYAAAAEAETLPTLGEAPVRLRLQRVTLHPGRDLRREFGYAVGEKVTEHLKEIDRTRETGLRWTGHITSHTGSFDGRVRVDAQAILGGGSADHSRAPLRTEVEWDENGRGHIALENVHPGSYRLTLSPQLGVVVQPRKVVVAAPGNVDGPIARVRDDLDKVSVYVTLHDSKGQEVPGAEVVFDGKFGDTPLERVVLGPAAPPDGVEAPRAEPMLIFPGLPDGAEWKVTVKTKWEEVELLPSQFVQTDDRLHAKLEL